MSFTNMAGLPLSQMFGVAAGRRGGPQFLNDRLTERGASVIYPPVEQQFQTSSTSRARRDPPGTTAIDRGAELLVRVLESEQPIALAELASASGIPKSTASRLVTALERQGLVEQDGERGRLRPGPAILRVAERGMLERSIVELARPSLDVAGRHRPARRSTSPCPARQGVEHIAQVDSAHFLGAGQWLGRSVDYHCTANGKVFMAFERAPIPARPPALTERTITDPARLTAELARVRRDDFAEAIDELEIGLAAIAAPVRGAGGRGRRRAQHHRTDGAHDPGADRRTEAHPDRGGRTPEPAPRQHRARRTRRMTHEEILQLLYDETLVGNAPAVKDGVNDGLEDGLEPERMLYDALIPSLEEVGARFERGDYFVPEMLIAARAMQGALDILRPLLAETGTAGVGTFLMGTVKGDVHDIGKNLCNIMLEGAGFTVIDLGVNVPPEKFVEQIGEHNPDIVGFSAFLTTTMPMFKANINALEKAGIRDDVIVMVGGAPVTQEYADAVGADGYSADASSAVKKAKELIELRREKVPA